MMYFTVKNELIKSEEHINEGGVNEWDEAGSDPLPKGSYRIDYNVICYENKKGNIEQIGECNPSIVEENNWKMVITDIITSIDGRRVK